MQYIHGMQYATCNYATHSKNEHTGEPTKSQIPVKIVPNIFLITTTGEISLLFK